MRFFYILAMASLVSACHYAKLDEACGLTTPCAEGRCVDGICTACGGLDEVCCAEPGGSAEVCDGNVACVGATYDYGTCHGDCGLEGGPCCDGSDCFDGSTCHLGKCTDLGGGTVDPECHDPSGQVHKVYVIDDLCNAQPITIQTKTEEKAEECRKALYTNDLEICPLDAYPQETHACGYSSPATLPDSVTFLHCSTAQLKDCEQNTCVNCDTWIETPGDCPSTPPN